MRRMLVLTGLLVSLLLAQPALADDPWGPMPHASAEVRVVTINRANLIRDAHANIC